MHYYLTERTCELRSKRTGDLHYLTGLDRSAHSPTVVASEAPLDADFTQRPRDAHGWKAPTAKVREITAAEARGYIAGGSMEVSA